MNRRPHGWLILTGIIAITIILIAIPNQWKPWAPTFVREFDFHFGLDLAGGTQLDFRISEDELRRQIKMIDDEIALLQEEGSASDRLLGLRTQQQAVHEQQQNIVEAIRTVLERRINALGVSETTITPSYVGDEKHLLVECPGVVNTQVCIDTVGKTIQLEFKEEFTEPTEEFEAEVRSYVDDVLTRIKAGDDLQIIGQDLGDELGIAFRSERPYFKDELPKGLESLWNKKPGGRIERIEGEIVVQQPRQDGETSEANVPGVFLAEITKPKSQTGRTINNASTAFGILANREPNLQYRLYTDVSLNTPQMLGVSPTIREMQPGEVKIVSMSDGTTALLFLHSYKPPQEEMTASHVLVTYKGASAADTSVKRTKDEAFARARDLKKQLDAGAPFEEIARKQSDGPSAAKGGSLGTFGRGAMVPAFEQALLALRPGEISHSVETQFGFHLIRLDKPPSPTPDIASFEELSVGGTDAQSRASSLLSLLQQGQITRQEDVVYLRTLFFSLLPTGWKDTPLDGKHFRAATVTIDPITNIPVVQIMFDDEGGQIFQELTKRNVGKRIAIFVGGELVSAPVVQQEITGGTAIITGNNSFDDARRLAQDLNTGAIPAPIHLSGQRTVEATLGAEALRTSLQAAILGSIILVLYLLAAYRFLGLLASITLLIYAVLFWVILKLPLFFFSSQYIVLTLAGMAGIILSIGMAVDANVLVFERFKEELRKGKLFKTAIEVAFDRAWPSIRDSNISTILTCIILFVMGTSIVRGFAVTLGIGVVISMFTAIIITRWMLRYIAQTDLPNRPWLFGIEKKEI